MKRSARVEQVKLQVLAALQDGEKRYSEMEAITNEGWPHGCLGLAVGDLVQPLTGPCEAWTACDAEGTPYQMIGLRGGDCTDGTPVWQARAQKMGLPV